ncbi:MAG TPA: hypothetical protein VGF06_09840 [Terriglobales bacterium]|jgi:hypothetical protein
MGSQSRHSNDLPADPKSAPNLACPICRANSTRVLEQREIYISDKAETKKVGAQLAAFRCDQAGHVFFVMAQDLQ